MNRPFVNLPLLPIVPIAIALILAVIAACHRDAGPAQPGDTQAGRALSAPPPAPDVTPLPGPDANQLAVVTARPQGELQGLARPTLTFNKPVVALATLEQGGAGPAGQFVIEPAAAGLWRWLGSFSVEFVPSAQFPYATGFTVSVPAGLAALDGSKLVGPFSFRFTTPLPQVQEYLTVPGRDACQFSVPDQVFQVLVNQPIAEPEARFFFDPGSGPAGRISAKVLKTVNVQDERRDAETKGAPNAEPRRFARASSDDLGLKNWQTRYELQPQAPLPKGRAFSLRLEASAHGTQGPLPMGRPFGLSCAVYGPMRAVEVTRCWGEAEHCSFGPVWLKFTNPVGAIADLKQRLSIAPSVALDWDGQAGEDDDGALFAAQRTAVRLPARWRPGTTYTISLAAGVKDKFGQEAPAFEGQVTLDDLVPSLYLGRELALLEAAGDGQLPVQVTNVAEIAVDAWVISPQQYLQLRYCNRYQKDCSVYPPGPPDSQVKLPTDLPKNESQLRGLDLRAVLAAKGAKTGLLVLRISAPGTPTEREPLRVLAQLTDVIVHAKIGATGGVAWVTSAQTGAPLAGARVSIFSAQGQVGPEVLTGPDGLATLPPNQELDPRPVDRAWEPPRLLVAASFEGDLGVVTTARDDQLSGQEASPSFDVLGQRPLGEIFTDRGIYRPGDTVHAKALLRRFSPGQASGLSTPKGEVKFSLRAPDGQVLLEKTVAISAYGTAGLDLVVPKEGRLGTYDLTARLVSDPQQSWSGSFSVAEYRAPQFRVDVLTATKDLLAGSKLAATVSARYLFGGAMTGAQASWSVVRSTSAFSPPRHGGYSFGRQTSYQDESEPGPTSGLFASGKGTVDAKGNLAIDAGVADAPSGLATQYQLEAEVQDVSRQTVAGRQGVLVHPAAFYLGLGKQSLFVDAGKPFRLPIVAVAPDGAEVAGVAVKVTALQRAWHAVRKKGVNGVYQTITEMVDEAKGSCELKTAPDAVACVLTLLEAGFYTLRAEAKDDVGRAALSTVGIYVLGKGFAAWQRGDSPKVEMVADKSDYNVGDVAHVLIKSPYPECRALISVEREGVQERRVQTLTGTATAIDIPITEAMIPNIFVGAVLQRARVTEGGLEPGDDPGRPSVRAGYAELSVGRAVKRLLVQVSVPKAEWRPREKVPVEISVHDAAGAPRKAEVVVYAVDEAVLQLTGYQVPDPVDEMFPRHELGVALGEPLLSLVRRQKFGEKGELQPGGGGGRGPGGDPRSNFVTTALWTTLETGKDGKAKTELVLPDNLTTFRIMAVALTDQDRFGSGQTQVRVSLPLLVLPALPRFARTGDQFEGGVVVNAKGLAAQQSEVQVVAQVSGAVALAPGQPALQTVTAVEGVAHEVRFKLVATGNGEAKLVFRASAEGDDGQGGAKVRYTDAVEQTIPVEVPVSLEAVAVYGETASQATEGLLAPVGARPGTGGLTVTLSSSALGGLGEGMRQLIDYPYGCVEQLSSRLIPFVALREVQKVFGLKTAALTNEQSAKHATEVNALLRALTGHEDSEQSTDADTVVKQTVARLERLQAPSGGFHYWPGEGCTYAWPSIFATLALHRAREAGYPVRQATLDAAKQFLARKAEGQPGCQLERVGLETRAFALQVLARMGDPRPALADALYEKSAELPLFGKALLADALVLGKGKRQKAQALLQDLLDKAQETPSEVHFAETDNQTYAPLFSSDVRTTGMVLQTLVDLQPTHPFVGKIARYFNSVRRGGAFRNTQEAAYALMGLTEVVRVRERTAPDFTARVTLGGKQLASEKFAGRSLAVVTKKIPMVELLAAAKAAGKGSAPLVFAADGTGLLTYGALLRYAPAELPTKPRDEGLFVQRWFEPYDQPGKAATEFVAGELVRVRLRVATRMERHFVAIDVPLPAGLEAVDLQLATTSHQAKAADEERPEGSGEEGYDDHGASDDSFWSPFNYSEKRDDRVVYFSDQLPPGVHVQSFVARATTPGKFLLKPAQAEEMYTPEVFGRSEGGTLTVSAQRPLAQK